MKECPKQRPKVRHSSSVLDPGIQNSIRRITIGGRKRERENQPFNLEESKGRAEEVWSSSSDDEDGRDRIAQRPTMMPGRWSMFSNPCRIKPAEFAKIQQYRYDQECAML